ncbi:unnamed protein product [Nezara viridula]|uniref:Uncharacterized protein n=1 Tax=Nezara viridula TaxID=85310 RepID=A0A9P0ED44_NEZVI|nr:unnamed protein product [Nezara viridula]
MERFPQTVAVCWPKRDHSDDTEVERRQEAEEEQAEGRSGRRWRRGRGRRWRRWRWRRRRRQLQGRHKGRPQEAPQEVHVPAPHRLQAQVPHPHTPVDRRPSSHRGLYRIRGLLLRPLRRRCRSQEGLISTPSGLPFNGRNVVCEDISQQVHNCI